MIAYPAMLDVPRELVREVARLLRAERRLRGTRKGSRVLSCWFQALLVLAWFRNQGDLPLVAAGFGVSRATAYRYRDEVIDVLADQATTSEPGSFCSISSSSSYALLLRSPQCDLDRALRPDDLPGCASGGELVESVVDVGEGQGGGVQAVDGEAAGAPQG